MGSRRLLFCASLLAVPALVFGCNGDELSSPTNGSLDIVTTTAGDAPDPDGYTVQVDDAQPRPIGPSGRLQSGAIAPGDHTVTLGGIASNCDVVGTNPRTVNVTAGVTNTVSFQLTCSPQPGTLEITTTSSGESLDPNGYSVSVDGGAARPVGSNGTVTFSGLEAGTYAVSLADVAPNCLVAEGGTQTVGLTAGGTATARFSLACSFIGITIWTPIPLPSSVNPVLTFMGGRTLWGTSASDLFVIAQASQPSARYCIWHYDGTGWTEQVSRVDTALSGIWGFFGTDVYAVGQQVSDGETRAGVILHFDGTAWSDVGGPIPSTPGTITEHNGIWGPATGDLFLAGWTTDRLPRTELLAHFDGSRWSRPPAPASPLGEFTNLAGSSDTDVWAIGRRITCDDCNHDTAEILHFDGRSWAEQFSRNADNYSGVWATAPNDVWVVGENGEQNANVLHYDGHLWTRGEPLSTSQSGLQDVWASSPTDVYAVGYRTLLHYDGSAWSRISEVGGNRVWGLSREDVFILLPDAVLHGKP